MEAQRHGEPIHDDAVEARTGSVSVSSGLPAPAVAEEVLVRRADERAIAAR
jgi:hypothetical protein